MRWLGCALAAVSLATGPVLAVPAQPQSAERIVDYHVDLRIEQSGELLVRERIRYDFGGQARHGIQRDLPVRLRYDDQNDRLYPVRVVGVHGSPGAPDQYRLEDLEGDAGSLLRIRIGNPDETITGQHEYLIDYRVQGVLDGFAGHDELYWNVVGTQWKVPIGRASATVTAPAAVTEMACRAGPSGSRRPCTSSLVDGRTASFAIADLAPAEGLIVRVGFPAGVVSAPRPILRERWSLARGFAVTPSSLGLAGGLLAAVLILGGLLVVAGRDRRVGTANAGPVELWDGRRVVPWGVDGTSLVEPVPPEGIRPGQAGLLIDKAVTPLAIAATVVDLAVRGYLRVGQVPNGWGVGELDWRLVQLKEQDGNLLEYERVLLAELFEGPFVVRRAQQHRPGDQGFPGAGTAVVEEGLASVLLSNLQVQFRHRVARVRSALYEQAVRQGWFAVRPDRVRRALAWLGVAVAMVGVSLTVLLAWQTHLGLVPTPIVLAGFALVVAAWRLPRRTPKGAELAGRVRGFRANLERAGVDAARSVEAEHLVTTHLPYGIVFGVTPQALGVVAEVGAPSRSAWYRGQGPFAVREFCSRIQHMVRWRATMSPISLPWGRGSDQGGLWRSGGHSAWGGSSNGGGGGGDGGGGGGGGDSW